MIQRKKLAGLIAAGLSCAFIAPYAGADGDFLSTHRSGSRLSGYEETPLTISSPGSGTFILQVRDDFQAIDYSLSYQDLVDVTQAHIHVGAPATTGGIVLFLCTNLAPPAGVPTPQPCPTRGGTITGTLTAANIVPQPGQHIDPDGPGFDQVLRAVRFEAAYANVHTLRHQGGEIRGQLSTRGF